MSKTSKFILSSTTFMKNYTEVKQEMISTERCKKNHVILGIIPGGITQ